MIQLSVRDYCQNCPCFKADVDKIAYSNGQADTMITCANHTQCELINNHLKKTQEVKDGDYIPPKRA